MTVGDSGVDRSRIERIAKELMPHGKVIFDPAGNNGIGFKIVDNNTNTILAATSAPISSHDLQTRSDDWLRQFICELGGGDI